MSHTLALSGFHVGIIVMFLQFFFLSKLLPLRWQWVSHLFLIAILWSYALLVGWSPSLVRATFMFTLLLLCQFLSKDSLSIISCALAFLVMTCGKPFYINDVGFQLSFVSVGSIALFVPAITERSLLQHWNPCLAWLYSLVMVSLICMVFSTPLVAYHFGRVPLLSLLGNLALTPFVYVIILGSIFWWMFLWCAPVNEALTLVLNWTAETMNGIVHSIADLPFATLEWHPQGLHTFICYLVLVPLFYYLTKKLRKLTSMTQDQLWTSNYQMMMDFMEEHHRRPSKHRLEEHRMLYWFKQQKKTLANGKLKSERMERFLRLLALADQFRRKNQYSQ